MNCKQGDMAFIAWVAPEGRHAGMMVEVISPIGIAPVQYDGEHWFRKGDGFIWLVKSLGSPLADQFGVEYSICPCPDNALRPIRPGDISETTDSELGIKEPA